MRKSSVILIGLVALISISYLIQCAAPHKEAAQSVYLNLHDSVGYVGIQTCAQCHVDKFETFVHTGMGSSFGRSDKDRSSAQFGSEHLVYDSTLDYYYYPHWKDDSLFITEYRITDGDTVHRRTEYINFIVGSGHHTNSHLMWRNGYVFQAPITFYTQKEQWDLAPGFENGSNSRFTRVIDQECMTCHNSLGEMYPESNRRFEKIGNGIDCERCHGPGEKHVYFRSSGGIPTGEIDSTIVNPADLNREYQIDLCQRCHLQGNNVLKPGKRFSDFKPGMRLKDVFEVYLPEYAGDHSLFNMANHSERLQLSACFKESASGALTCITCHNPHVSVRTLGTDVFTTKCKSCHEVDACAEDRAIRASKDDDCIACHMPPTGAEDIPHVTVHDHKIAVHRDSTSAKGTRGEPVGLRCINNPNPEETMLVKAYLTYYEKFDGRSLYREKAREILDKIDAPLLEVHYAFQVGDWDRIVALSRDITTEETEALDCYRIAEAYSGVSEFGESSAWMELAVLKAPERFEYLDRLGVVLKKNGELNGSIMAFERCLKLNPKYKPALNNLAEAYFQMGNVRRAREYVSRCLSLDPDYGSSLRTLQRIISFENERD